MNFAWSKTESRAGYLPEVRSINIRHGICEMWCVEEVVGLATDLKARLLHNGEVFKQRNVVVREVRSSEYIPCQVSELAAG